jgi:ParB family transcriptional regulator, chromosome partitioning protein
MKKEQRTMNATMAVKTTAGASQVSPSFQELPLDSITESQTNPRRHFDETKLSELAENIKQHGVLQPILVRPLPEGAADTYELVAGARRYRASKLARLDTIPAAIRELTNAQCLELQLIENLQRADVHELDEAQGYAALMQLQPDTYTVETIAAKVGKSQAYVYARLRLIQLIPDAKRAFYDAKLTVAHAFEIARLQPRDQTRALQECFPQHKNPLAILKDRKAEAVTVRELRQWIEREIHLDLTSAPFDPQDESLLPSAGACARCPKRTGNNPLLFPELRHKSICTDRECYAAKLEALVQIRVKALEAEGHKPVRVSQAPSWQGSRRGPNLLYEGQYRKANARAECPTTEAAVLVDGKCAGTVFHVCQNERCHVHARVTRYEPTPQQRVERAKQAMTERVEKQSRIRILDAIRKKLPDNLSRPDFEMAALDYFRRLGHDNHRRLCKVYGWGEKKSKASRGAETMDYEKLARAAVQTMLTASLCRFLVVCALVSDLHCPGYTSSQQLPRDSNLWRAASRYKIDTGRITNAVRAEFSARVRRHQTQSKRVAKSARAKRPSTSRKTN